MRLSSFFTPTAPLPPLLLAAALLVHTATAQDRTTEQGEAQITSPSHSHTTLPHHTDDSLQARQRSAPYTTTLLSVKPSPPVNSPLSGLPQPSFQTMQMRSQSTKAFSPRYPTFNQTDTNPSPSRETGPTLHIPLLIPTVGGRMHSAQPQRLQVCPQISPLSQRYGLPPFLFPRSTLTPNCSRIPWVMALTTVQTALTMLSMTFSSRTIRKPVCPLFNCSLAYPFTSCSHVLHWQQCRRLAPRGAARPRRRSRNLRP